MSFGSKEKFDKASDEKRNINAKPKDVRVTAEADKDAAFQEEKEAELLFYGANSNPEQDREGITHINHDRRGVLNEFTDAHLASGEVGRRFVFNEESIRTHKKHNFGKSFNSEDFATYLDKLGIENASGLFAGTLSSDGTYSIGKEAERGKISNHALSNDAQEFFLSNIGEFKTSLARTLLAKIDLDRDLRGSLSELINMQDSPNNENNEVLFQEIKNKLRNNNAANNKEYQVVLKIFDKMDKIHSEHDKYVAQRQKSAFEIIDTVNKSKKEILVGESIPMEKEDLASAERRDDKFIEELSSLFAIIEEKSISLNGSTNVHDAYDAVMTHFNKEETEESAPPFLTNLGGRINNHDVLANKSAIKMKEEVEEFVDTKEKFIKEHNNAMDKSTKILSQLAFKSEHYPVAILSRWADENYFNDNFTHTIGNDDGETLSIEKLDKDFSDAIKLSKPDVSEEELENIVKNFKSLVSENKDLFEAVYDPEKDEANPQRQYLPFTLQKHQEEAQNVLRDSLYLSLFKSNEDSSKIYNTFYQHKDSDDNAGASKNYEREIISSIFASSKESPMPDGNEVIDLYNMNIAVNKVALGKMSPNSFKNLFDSPIMENNNILNEEEKKHLESYGKSLASESMRIKEKDIFGTPTEEKELIESIQESIRLEAGYKEVEKLKKVNITSVRGIGRFFLQNNKALRELEVCMGNQPTTSMETKSSLSRQCMDNLKKTFEEHEKKANEMISNPQAAWAGSTFVGALLLFEAIHAASSKDLLERVIAKVNTDIIKETQYVASAMKAEQTVARKLNVDTDIRGMGHTVVDANYADEIQKEAETEATIRGMIKHSGEEQPRSVKLLDGRLLESLLDGRSVSNEALLTEKRKSIEREKEYLVKLKETIQNQAKSSPQRVAQKEFLEQKIIETNKIQSELNGFEHELANLSMGTEDKVSDITSKIELKKIELTVLKEEINQNSHEIISVEDKRRIANSQKHIDKMEEEINQVASNDDIIQNSLHQKLRTVILNGSAISMDLNFEPQPVVGEKPSREEKLIERKRLAEERNETIKLLGAYRDELNRKLLYNADNMPNGAKKDAQRDIDVLNRLIPKLGREAIADKYNLGEALAHHLNDTYNIKIDDELIKEIQSKGLKNSVITDIMTEVKASDVSSDKINKISREIQNFKNARKTFKSGEMDVSMSSKVGFNSLSSYFKIYREMGTDGVGKIIEDNNNFAAVKGSATIEGKVAIATGVGIAGMAIHDIEEAIKENDHVRLQEIENAVTQAEIKGRLKDEVINSVLAEQGRGKSASVKNQQVRKEQSSLHVDSLSR